MRVPAAMRPASHRHPLNSTVSVADAATISVEDVELS
jgi:hypothetical protein